MQHYIKKDTFKLQKKKLCSQLHQCIHAGNWMKVDEATRIDIFNAICCQYMNKFDAMEVDIITRNSVFVDGWFTSLN